MLQTLLSVFCARGGGGSWEGWGGGRGWGSSARPDMRTGGEAGPVRRATRPAGRQCACARSSGSAPISHWTPRGRYLHTTPRLRPRKCVPRGGGAAASLPPRGLSGRWRTRCPGGAERPGRGGSQRGRERHVGGARREGQGRRGGAGAGDGVGAGAGRALRGWGRGSPYRASAVPLVRASVPSAGWERAEIRAWAAGGRAEGGPSGSVGGPGVPARRDPGPEPGPGPRGVPAPPPPQPRSPPQGPPVPRSPPRRPARAMLRLLPWLRALSRHRARPGSPRGPAERSGAAMHPACYCAGRARPRALLLPLDPYGHGLLHALPPDACRTRGHGKRKSWNFIHEKMSYDTFFTMKRLIERSRSVGEVLRWVTQNPGKVSASHYPIALHKLGQLLQQQQGPAALNGESRRPGPVLEQPEFQTLCQAIISGCSKFDNFSIVNCLYAAAALGEWPGHGAALRASCGERRVRCRGRA